MKLYEIDEAIENFEFQIDEETGEVTNIGDFDALQMAREKKIENAGKYYKNLISDYQQLYAEAQNMMARANAYKNRANGIKTWIAYALKGEKFESEDKTLRIATASNGGKIPIIYNEAFKPDNAPKEFQKVSYSYDGEKVRQALESGEQLPFARFGERGTHLTIK